MSHLFHGLLINLIRRSDCQTIEPESLGEDQGDLEDEWKAWIEAEQKKRCADIDLVFDPADCQKARPSMFHVGHTACRAVLPVPLHVSFRVEIDLALRPTSMGSKFSRAMAKTAQKTQSASSLAANSQVVLE